MFNTPQELRQFCLQLAVQARTETDSLIAVAKELERYITGDTPVSGSVEAIR